MAKNINNNVFLVLAVVLLMVSMLSTAVVLTTLDFQSDDGTSPGTGDGDVKFTVLRDSGAKSDSTTGYIGVKVLPDDDN